MAAALSRSLCVDAQTAVSASVQIARMGVVGSTTRSVQHSSWATKHEVARITFWKTEMETTMIDGNLWFSLELCALAVLVGVGVWRIYRTRQSATINASAVAYDMRQDGQRLSVQTDPR